MEARRSEVEPRGSIKLMARHGSEVSGEDLATLVGRSVRRSMMAPTDG